LSQPPSSSAWGRRRRSGSLSDMAAANTATDPPPMTAKVAPSISAAIEAERGGSEAAVTVVLSSFGLWKLGEYILWLFKGM